MNLYRSGKGKTHIIAAIAGTLAVILALSGCGSSSANGGENGVTVINLASRNELPEIWDAVNEELKDDNIKVVNKAYDTSVNLNDLLLAGDIDMNVAQHKAYLDMIQSSDDKYKELTSIGDLHISTLDLYSNKVKSVKDLPDGATIAIPNDPINGGRAIDLLAQSGLVKISSNVKNLPSQKDIISNPKNLKLQEIASDSMVRILDDVDAGFVYAVNAVDGGLDPTSDPIYKDDIDFAKNPQKKQFIIIFTVRDTDKNNANYKKVVEAFHTKSVYEQYRDVYKNRMIPVDNGKAIDINAL